MSYGFERGDGGALLHEIVERIAQELKEAEKSHRRQPLSASQRKKSKPEERPPSRTLNQQLLEVNERLGIRKKDIANRMGVDASYVSQLLARGLNETHIRKIAAACGVKPQYFDQFVAVAAKQFLMKDAGLLNVVRAYIYEADDDIRRAFLGRAKNLFGSRLQVDYLRKAAKR